MMLPSGYKIPGGQLRQGCARVLAVRLAELSKYVDSLIGPNTTSGTGVGLSIYRAAGATTQVIVKDVTITRTANYCISIPVDSGQFAARMLLKVRAQIGERGF